MKNFSFALVRDFLLVTAIVCFVLLLFGVFLKITHFNIGFLTGNMILTIALIPNLIIWALVLFDVCKNSPKNFLLIIIGLLFFGNIVAIIYLWRRNELITPKTL